MGYREMYFELFRVQADVIEELEILSIKQAEIIKELEFLTSRLKLTQLVTEEMTLSSEE